MTAYHPLRARHGGRVLLVRALLLAVSLTTGWSSLAPVRADKLVGQPLDGTIAMVIDNQLQRMHISRRPVDDEISRRTLKRYLEGLDPLKLYFLKSDIDEFKKDETRIDDMLRSDHDVSLAYKIFNRYLERLEQRVKLAEELVKEPHDFTVKESFVTDPDTAEYAVDEAAARDRWRKRIKYDLLALKRDKVTGQEAQERLTRRYQSLLTQMNQTKPSEVVEMFLTAVAASFDPHSSYMSPDRMEDFRIRMQQHYQGIGAELESKDGLAIIRRIMPGGGAEKGGELKAGDQIVSVGQGDEGVMVDVVEKRLGDIVDLIRGTEGTIVRVGVITAGTSERKVYKIKRSRIELQDSVAKGEVFEAGKKEDGTPFKVGVVNLPSFYGDTAALSLGLPDARSTTRDVEKILEQFNQQGADALVLDLRHNGGGLLGEAINLTGLFVERAPVVQVKDFEQRVQVFDDTNPGIAWKKPMIVLIDRFSASASEILAGAIQDYRRGLVVGDTSTHGKGTVQSLIDPAEQLFRGQNQGSEFGVLKVTIQKFYRPSGESTQKRGVHADVVLPALSDHLDIGEASLDYAIDFDTVDKADYKDYGLVDPELIAQLRAKSKARVADSADFQKTERRIARYEAQKDRKSVPLNEEEYNKLTQSDDEEAAGDAEEGDGEEDEQPSARAINSIERNGYLDEVLNIARDYFTALGGRSAE